MFQEDAMLNSNNEQWFRWYKCYHGTHLLMNKTNNNKKEQAWNPIVIELLCYKGVKGHSEIQRFKQMRCTDP